MTKIQRDELEFHKLLQVLADQCNFQISEAIIELYDQGLRGHGYARVNVALKEIFNTRKGGDRFPAVGDILERMGLVVSDRALAVEASNLIFWAFTHWKLDYCRREDFEQLIISGLGALPTAVIHRMGGYRALYKEWNEATDVAILRAQVRDAALALIELNRAELAGPAALGGQAQPPQLKGKPNG